MKKLIITQCVILFSGTVFAWTNFGIEYVNWINKKSCTSGCAVGLVNPFLTPCFYGACFFLLAFVVSVLIYRNFTESQKPKIEPKQP